MQIKITVLAIFAFVATTIAQSHHGTAHGLKAATVAQGQHLISQGQGGSNHNTAHGKQGATQSQNEHEHAAYQFEYGVKDSHTHDVHSQSEHRDGKHVIGEYTLHESDGTQRIVKYKAGHHTGFEAIVERQGHAQHPAPHGHGKDAKGGTSYVGVTHWINQGGDEHGH